VKVILLALQLLCHGAWKYWCFFLLTMVFATAAVHGKDFSLQGDAFFKCGSHLESKIWLLWDSKVKPDLRADLVERRLKSMGDTVALYDMQSYLSNLASMANRCNRSQRLKELNAFVRAMFPDDRHERRLSGASWICRSGPACAEGSYLHNKEVLLHSVQFLGLLSTLAVYSSDFEDAESVEFVEDVFKLSINHLLMWAKASRTSDDFSFARKGDFSRSTLFTDKPLWMLVIYVRVAALLEKRPQLESLISDKNGSLRLLAAHSASLAEFMEKRITFSGGMAVDGFKERMAELDGGYWSKFSDNRYAGYRASLKPVLCIGGQPETIVPYRDEFIVPDLGWDFSHARRLVHAADAFFQNGEAAKRILGLKSLPGEDFFKGFSKRVVQVVWNQSLAYPLFTNYLSGANGWYRAGYSPSKGQCSEGFEPYGLSFSFADGGYAAFGRFEPKLKEIGRKIFFIMQNQSQESDSAFVARYYPAFHRTAKDEKRARAQIMFWPTLVD